MRNSVRQITDGAMMIAIIGVFAIINRQFLFVIEEFAAFLIPLPLLFYTVKHGVRNATVVLFCMVVVGLLFGTPKSMFFLGVALINGLTYGYGVRKQKTNEWLLAITIIINLITVFLTTYAFASFFGYNVGDEVKAIVEFFKAVDGMKIDATVMATMYMAIPLMLILIAFLQALLTHISSILLLKRLKIAVLPMRPLNQIRVSKPIGWIALALLFAPTFAGLLKAEVDMIVMANLIYLIALLLFSFDTLIFLSLLGPIVKIKQLPNIGLLIFLLIPGLMTNVFIVIGALDILTDFRERTVNRR